MIKNINYNRNFLSFENSNDEIIIVDPMKYGYPGICSFLQIEDGIICVFEYGSTKNMDLELRRRNVMKFDENGKIIWIVSDLLDIWEKKFHGDKQKLEIIKNDAFDVVSKNKEGKVVLNGGPEYFVDAETGELNFWRSRRF